MRQEARKQSVKMIENLEDGPLSVRTIFRETGRETERQTEKETDRQAEK